MNTVTTPLTRTPLDAIHNMFITHPTHERPTLQLPPKYGGYTWSIQHDPSTGTPCVTLYNVQLTPRIHANVTYSLEEGVHMNMNVDYSKTMNTQQSSYIELMFIKLIEDVFNVHHWALQITSTNNA